MDKHPSITLAGGFKAPGPRLATPPAVTINSPAFAAFTLLTDALAEACAAAELRADDAAWDVALADPDAAAEDAMNIAMTAARAAGDAQILLASDRQLVFAARFISCALGIEHCPDREHVLHFIDSSRALFGAASGRVTARRAEALVERATLRLMRLCDLMAEDSNTSVNAL